MELDWKREKKKGRKKRRKKNCDRAGD